MSNTAEHQKRVIADGIATFCTDVVSWGFAWTLVYLGVGILFVGIISCSQWLFGDESGEKIGFWATILGGIIIAVMWHKAWWKNERRRRAGEYRRYQEEVERIIRGGRGG